MEALNFLRFWINSYGIHKLSQTQHRNGKGGATPFPAEVFDHELDEGDDAFIDLQFPLHEVEDKGNVGNKELVLSPNDHFSKRKILPIEPISKPQSPIALLKSAQKFRVFTPKKPKPETPKHEKQGGGGGGKHFAVQDSSRKTNGKTDDSSKGSSKDLMHRYLNAIKPLYTKISKKNSQRISGDSSLLSPSASSANTRRIYKHLGKSKSSSAAASRINRGDDSLLLQDDGIQGAILHCKRSFNSSRAESSWLSRFPSDSSSQEKLSNASSTDSSLFSRATSSSARTSSEEGNVFT